MSELPDRMMTMEAVMEKLSLNRAEVYRQVKDGKLKSEKVDHQLQFTEAEVERFDVTRSADTAALQETVSDWLQFFSEQLSGRELVITDLTDKPVGDQINELGRQILLDALSSDVKDIYIDPMHEGDRLIYNTNGHRNEIARFKTALSTPLKTWLKSLVTFPVTDPPGIKEALGRQTYIEPGGQYRTTVIPTLLGEHIHIHFFPRFEDEHADSLAYTPVQIEVLRGLLKSRPGLILITGAIDLSAEQHRLALAHEFSEEGRLVASLEHQVQYRSDSLVQLDIGEKNGAGFKALWQTVLNMRPDAIIFDECRDKEEMHALIEGAYSGAVVVAHVRSTDPLDALTQLLQYELNREALSRVLLGVVERMTVSCPPPECLHKRPATPEEARLLEISDETLITVLPSTADITRTVQRTIFGIWPMDEALKTWIRHVDAPRAVHSETRHQSLSLSWAFRNLVVDHDMALEDAAPFIIPATPASE